MCLCICLGQSLQMASDAIYSKIWFHQILGQGQRMGWHLGCHLHKLMASDKSTVTSSDQMVGYEEVQD